MGRIKSAIIKRTSRTLLKEPNKFSSDFRKNKSLLKNLKVGSLTKNKIAGYLVRLKRAEMVKAIPEKQ